MRGVQNQHQLDLFMVTEDLYNAISVEDGDMWLANVLRRKTWIGGGSCGLTLLQKRLQARVDHAKSAIKMNSTILQSDLYLNPDPLVRLIGESNEAVVKIEGQKFDSLIDSAAQISQLTESLVKALDLKIRNLKEMLPLEGAAGIKAPWVCRGSIGDARC